MSMGEPAESRLGRGLDSLITRTGDAPQEVGVLEVPLDSIRVNPQQPRRNMDEEALAGLAASVTQHGVLQPIVVRRQGTGYELIAGERRFRASRIAGKKTIPVTVVEAKGTRSLELALIENIQREDLSPLDEAEAYQQLLGQYGMTHQELAEQLGRSRAVISNGLRLLDLPDEVQQMLDTGTLSSGQARAILGLGDRQSMLDMAATAAKDGLSVRQVEDRVRSGRPTKKAKRSKAAGRSQKTSFYEEKLMKMYDSRVVITPGANGEVRFSFHSTADRDRLIHQLLTGQSEIGDG
jgi:ParB family chromosome partitioning protein